MACSFRITFNTICETICNERITPPLIKSFSIKINIQRVVISNYHACWRKSIFDSPRCTQYMAKSDDANQRITVTSQGLLFVPSG